MVRRVEINAAASFWGYTDEWPDAETTTYVSGRNNLLPICPERTVDPVSPEDRKESCYRPPPYIL
jgi:hypothetical protein